MFFGSRIMCEFSQAVRLLECDLDHLIKLSGQGSRYKINWLSIVRNAINPRFAPVILYRISVTADKIDLKFVAKGLSFLSYCVFGIEISLESNIGPGLVLPHTHGTVIGAQTIGKNVIIFQGVTLGAREIDFDNDVNKRPVLGDNVIVGAGAKVLGGIKIGNNVKIGANAVVLNSVPDAATVVGVPAHIARRKND